jgi:hypothetical protein
MINSLVDLVAIAVGRPSVYGVFVIGLSVREIGEFECVSWSFREYGISAVSILT